MAPPRSTEVALALVRGRRTVELGPVSQGSRCGLAFLDDLLRLQVALARLGWSLQLVDVPEELHELLDLVGLAHRLEAP
jgi:hypothetical protein